MCNYANMLFPLKEITFLSFESICKLQVVVLTFFSAERVYIFYNKKNAKGYMYTFFITKKTRKGTCIHNCFKYFSRFFLWFFRNFFFVIFFEIFFAIFFTFFAISSRVFCFTCNAWFYPLNTIMKSHYVDRFSTLDPISIQLIFPLKLTLDPN